MSEQQIPEDAKIILVMGPTGAGKSTFINYATKGTARGIGHELRSYTSDIRVVRPSWRTSDCRPVYFVDTPGFNDTFKSDIEILALVAEFFLEAYHCKLKIDTILYLHRITDNRMAGSPLKNLQLFASVCGNIAMPRVVLVTTMWRLVDPTVGTLREQELKARFWNGMIWKGCAVERFDDSFESVQHIIMRFSRSASVSDTCQDGQGGGILISHQIADHNKMLKETEAGVTLKRDLEKSLKDAKDANKKLRRLSQKQNNPFLKKSLESEAENSQRKIEEAASEVEELDLSLRKRLMRWYNKPEKELVPQIGPGRR
ncbi:hypothetical protein FRB91_008613 [Serendipita sp. 411]|nr:hypothetical protein FRC15_000638 [Serendipita sp. 397]KAG8828380.1 hypothetical protein FRC19_006478 [Serendipita sp. 401]KAG8834808.1 hypothetical protein FRC18_001482 [Serendipita sp. 400]KAG8859246.1 hypothetical protein FRB91_008613 [Serendipita sp. 411]KAG9058513.1 hypothetical protein FS842_008810 [Serendipita sp. 407]